MNRLVNLKTVILTAAAMTYLAAQAQTYGVNIVFTDLNKVTAVDTMIPASEDALEDLYSAFDLSRDEVHEIFLNQKGISWVGEEGEQHKMVIVETDVEVDAESKGEKQVKIVHMSSGDDKTMSEQEKQALVEELKAHHAKHGKGAEGEEIIMEKIVRVDKRLEKDGEGPEDDVEIRVVVENGVETVTAIKNGVQLSQEEARELLEKENVQIMHHGDMEKEMIFISEEEIVDGENVFIQKHEIKSSGAANNVAIAIIKEFPATTGTDETPAMKNNTLNLYPNPTKNQISARLEGVEGDYSVTITNLAGQVVRKEAGNASNSARHTVDLEGISSGTYILSIDHEGGVKSQKFVVE